MQIFREKETRALAVASRNRIGKVQKSPGGPANLDHCSIGGIKEASI